MATFTNLINLLLQKTYSIGSSKPLSIQDKYRIKAYNKVIQCLNIFPKNSIVTKNKINSLPISNNMKSTLNSLVKTKLSKTKLLKNLPCTELKVPPNTRDTETLVKKLLMINGIGNKLANDLVSAGLKHTRQLSTKKYSQFLPESVKLMIGLKPEKKIPHTDLLKIVPRIVSMGDSKHKIIPTGSFRRKAPFSRDIDIILLSPTPSLKWFVDTAKSMFPHVIVYSSGEAKMSMVVAIGSKNYKLDVFQANKKNIVPMLLYSTGSKDFNIMMRKKFRLKKSPIPGGRYLLNQNGLYIETRNSSGVTRKLVPLKTEEDYFKAIDLPYIPPEHR